MPTHSGWDALPGIIKKFQEESRLNSEQILKGFSLILFSEVAELTPVDEGITRGNWYVTKDRPSSKFSESKTEKGVPNILIPDFVGEKLFFTNNSPNILVLENGGYVDSSGSPSNGENTINGYSIQAPNGMVAVTLRSFKKILKEAVDESK